MNNPPVTVPDKWQTYCIKLTYNNNSETDTGFDIPKYAEIDPHSMMIFVQTIDATETINVGILSTESGGDADGFIVGASIATAGWVRPLLTATDGTNQNYISANTFGELFFKGLAGGDAAGTSGVPIIRSHIGDGTAKSISYTCSAGSDTFVGFLYFRMRQLPDLTNFLA